MSETVFSPSSVAFWDMLDAFSSRLLKVLSNSYRSKIMYEMMSDCRFYDILKGYFNAIKDSRDSQYEV